VAPDAAIEIEARPKAFIRCVGFFELYLALREERLLGPGEAGELATGSGRSSANPWISGDEWGCSKDLKRAYRQQRDKRHCYCCFDRRHDPPPSKSNHARCEGTTIGRGARRSNREQCAVLAKMSHSQFARDTFVICRRLSIFDSCNEPAT
jgi:hypothetical protein